MLAQAPPDHPIMAACGRHICVFRSTASASSLWPFARMIRSLWDPLWRTAEAALSAALALQKPARCPAHSLPSVLMHILRAGGCSSEVAVNQQKQGRSQQRHITCVVPGSREAWLAEWMSSRAAGLRNGNTEAAELTTTWHPAQVSPSSIPVHRKNKSSCLGLVGRAL